MNWHSSKLSLRHVTLGSVTGESEGKEHKLQHRHGKTHLGQEGITNEISVRLRSGLLNMASMLW